MAASAQYGVAHASGQRVQYPTRQNRACIRQRDHDAEGRFSRGEVPGPVNGIYDPVEPFARAVQHGWIGGACFFPDDACFGQDGGKPLRQPEFAFLVGDGDEIIGRFLGHLVAGEILVARHHHVTSHLAHQRDDGFMQFRGHQARPFLNCDNPH